MKEIVLPFHKFWFLTGRTRTHGTSMISNQQVMYHFFPTQEIKDWSQSLLAGKVAYVQTVDGKLMIIFENDDDALLFSMKWI